VWSNLDLEDHFAQDVVAATMAERLIRYMDTLRPLPRTTEIILLGTAKDAALLDDLGLVYRKNDKITEKAGLLLVGDIDALQQEAVTAFARSGGKVLVLPRTAPGQFLGAQFEMSTAFNGGYHIPRWTEAAGLSVSDTRYRTACSSIVVKGGVDETGINGLLGKKSLGKGSILFAQFDPNRFNADSVTYFRYTRWRQTRALAQVLSNLGATFLMDKAIFEQAEPTYSVLLDGMWKAVVTKPVPAAKEATLKHKDPGISEKALSYIKPDADEKGMVELPSGAPFEQATTAWAELDGEIVYRKTIDVPAALVGKELQLILGLIDDYDEVFINGISVGKTGVEMEPVWSYNRTYTVPPGVVKAGKNVMAIRIWDTYGGGGLMNGTKARELKPANQKVQGLYHSDYIDDFAMGDDPFRYFRW
jgi:beta-galactosidase